MSPEINGDHSLLGAYAVGALDDLERSAFERHLGACEPCMGELQGLTEAASALGEAEAVAPPLSLRASVMAEIARTAQVPPARPNVKESPQRRRRWSAGTAWIAGAAAAAVFAVAAIGAALRLREPADQISALESDIVMLSSAPDAHSMELGLGSSHLVMSERMDEVAVMGHDVPMPSKGMEYQLWFLLEDGTAVAGPTFMPQGDGDIMAMSEMGASRIASFAVTEEPMGGSSSPSGAVIARVDLS